MNNCANIVDDISGLSNLFVEGDAERCQGLQGILDVVYVATCDTKVQISGRHSSEVFDELEDLFLRRRHAMISEKFIESVQNEVNRGLSWLRKHLFQALYQDSIAGLLCTLIVFRIVFGESRKTRFGLTRKLAKDRKEEVPVTLLVFLPRVTVKICHGHRFCLF